MRSPQQFSVMRENGSERYAAVMRIHLSEQQNFICKESL
jgi:hypothetical protein